MMAKAKDASEERGGGGRAFPAGASTGTSSRSRLFHHRSRDTAPLRGDVRRRPELQRYGEYDHSPRRARSTLIVLPCTRCSLRAIYALFGAGNHRAVFVIPEHPELLRPHRAPYRAVSRMWSRSGGSLPPAVYCVYPGLIMYIP